MNFVLQPWHLLLTILAGLINRQQQEIIEYLRTENQPRRHAEFRVPGAVGPRSSSFTLQGATAFHLHAPNAGPDEVIFLLSDPAVVKRILDPLEAPSVPPSLLPSRVPAFDPRGEVELEPFDLAGDEGETARASGREEAARPPP
jgi:hypothetical protein